MHATFDLIHAAPPVAALPVFRPNIWYPLAGFAFLSFCCFTIFALTVWARINKYIIYTLALAGAGFALTSGMYASRGTWIVGVLGWAADWHPVVAFVLAFAALGLLTYVIVAAIPDRLAPAVSLTAALAAGAFLLPSLSLAALPERGSVWVNARQAITSTGDDLVTRTDGWFWSPSHTTSHVSHAAGGHR